MWIPVLGMFVGVSLSALESPRELNPRVSTGSQEAPLTHRPITPTPLDAPGSAGDVSVIEPRDSGASHPAPNLRPPLGDSPLLFGFGAHVEARIGVERALTEMTQGLGYFAQAEPPHEWELEDETDRREALAWWHTATLAAQSYLAPNRALPVKTAADYPRLWSDDLREDVEFCVSLAAQHGLETLVLDQTRPDIGLSVVKVIVPGLRHFWRRLAPGRLYDVPVELGWLPAPLPEDQLNPISMFL